MHQIRFRLGLGPRAQTPLWSLQRSPRPPSYIKGALLLRGRGERKGKIREGGGRGRGEGDGEGGEGGEEGKGKGGSSPGPRAC